MTWTRPTASSWLPILGGERVRSYGQASARLARRLDGAAGCRRPKAEQYIECERAEHQTGEDPPGTVRVLEPDPVAHLGHARTDGAILMAVDPRPHRPAHHYIGEATAGTHVLMARGPAESQRAGTELEVSDRRVTEGVDPEEPSPAERWLQSG